MNWDWQAFSIILLNVGRLLIGLKLIGFRSFFLWRGIIFAVLSFLGKLPDEKHLLTICVKGGARVFAQAFINFGLMLSTPDEVLEESVLINFHVW